jgi:hypothetical protein
MIEPLLQDVYLSAANYDGATTLHICAKCDEFITDSESITQIQKYIDLTGLIPNEAICKECKDI